jgi:uncharacterized protein (DUF983 family)
MKPPRDIQLVVMGILVILIAVFVIAYSTFIWKKPLWARMLVSGGYGLWVYIGTLFLREGLRSAEGWHEKK